MRNRTSLSFRNLTLTNYPYSYPNTFIGRLNLILAQNFPRPRISSQKNPPLRFKKKLKKKEAAN